MVTAVFKWHSSHFSHFFYFGVVLERVSHMVLVVKNLSASVGYVRDMGWISGSGRLPSHPVQHGNPFPHSCLENSVRPGGLQPMGSQRVGCDGSNVAHVQVGLEVFLQSQINRAQN